MRFSTSVALLSLAAVGCSADTATQALVWFDVEPGGTLEAQAVSVRVRAFDQEGAAVLDEERPLGELSLPASVSLLPRDPGAARGFRVELALLDGTDADLGRETVEGVFAPGERVELRVRFTEACAGVVCGFGHTCVDGACVRACFAPSEPGDVSPSEPAECGCACACDGDRCDGGTCVPRAPVVSIAAGRAHACAITEGGALYCWGDNGDGQLGAGDTEAHDGPVRVELPGSARDVSAGWRHTCAVLDDGALYCWGDNASRQLGVDGPSRATPTQVTDVGEVVHVAAGEQHTCAELGDGAVWCWGNDEFGQIGDGMPAPESRGPTPVVADETFQGAKIRLAAGFGHTCALLTIGRLWCWGRNFDGNLGVGDREHRPAPARILLEDGTEPTWTDLAIGSGWHTCAIADGVVYCFGDPANGRLGFESPDKVVWPTAVELGLVPRAVDAGVRHTCVTAEDGRVLCFGTNGSGELGVGLTDAAQDGPVALADDDWEMFALGEAFSCGVRAGGALYCWGENGARQLGLADRDDRNVPVRVCLP